MEKQFFPFVFILLISLFSLLVSPGYESFTADQPIFLPPLFHMLDPSLFPNGDLEHSRLIHSERTLLNDTLAFFLKLGIPLLWVLFILTATMRLLFFTSLYFVWRYFTDNTYYSLLILLIFITSFDIPAVAHGTTEVSFSYRTISIPLSLSFLALYLYGWHIFALVPLLFTFTIHPLTTLPFLLFYYLCIIYNIWHRHQHQRKNQYWHYAISAIIPIIFVLFFLWYTQSGATHGMFTVIDNDWKQLARERNNLAFFAFWGKNDYLSLVFWIALAGTTLTHLKHTITDTHKRSLIFLLLLAPIIMLMIATIGELTMLHGIVKLTMQRGLLILVLVAAPLFVLAALQSVDDHPTNILETGLLFAVLFWFLKKESFVFLQEQMFLFLIPLTILFLGNMLPLFQQKRRLLIGAATAAFMSAYGAVTARVLVYHDFEALAWFHVFLAGGFLVAWLSKKQLLTSISIAKSAVTIASIFLFAASLLYAKTFTIIPSYFSNKPYIEACAWVQQNTTKDSVFIVEPFVANPPPENFRLACLRPIFTTYKEGGVVPYDENRQVAFEWKKRYDMIYALKDNLLLLEQIKQEYRLDYIISETPLQLPYRYPLVFSNNAYYIYDIHK